MAKPTRDHRPPGAAPDVPWSPGEEAAYRALLDHTNGTPATPGCEDCRRPGPDCTTGTRLRLALEMSTTGRAG